MREMYRVTAEFDVRMKTRDGIDLAMDIYRPVDKQSGRPVEDPKPALLSRTPYGKRGQLERHGTWFAERGYVVVIQDCRGRYESDGEYTMFVNEAEDGQDTVEWLADQPYCDGQVGTFGSATMQSAIATQDPPHLEAMFVNQGAANGRTATYRHHGAFELRWLCWALTVGAGFSNRAREHTAIQQSIADTDLRDLLASEPIFPGTTALRHVPHYEEWVFEMMNNGRADSDLWSSPGIDFESHYDDAADCPAVFAGGWYDSYTKGTCDNFVALNELKDSEYYLLMGPWTHGWDRFPHRSWNKPHSGEISFGDAAVKNFQRTRLRFFDHYLKNRDTWADQPPVQYMMMGTGDGHRTSDDRLFHGGAWKTATDWPLPRTEYTPFYVHANGTLAESSPEEPSATSTYEFDPTDPVPTVGGNCSSYITFERSEKSVSAYPLSSREAVDFVPGGSFDQRTREDTYGATSPYIPLEQRNDILTFRTAPLEESLEICGPIRVTLFASTDAPDTDFTAKLIDEYPPTEDFPRGFSLNLADSIVRARYRDYRTEPEFVEPGKVYAFRLNLYPTANLFKPGHRIRLDISSSNYPRFDVNHNTGGDLYTDREYNVAKNTIHHDREYATHVELPIQQRGT